MGLKRSVTVCLSPMTFTKSLQPADYRALEEAVGMVAGLGDPVVVTGVFLAWPHLDVSVLYRTSKYDVYLVKDGHGRWLLSKITPAPVP